MRAQSSNAAYADIDASSCDVFFFSMAWGTFLPVGAEILFSVKHSPKAYTAFFHLYTFCEDLEFFTSIKLATSCLVTP